MKSAQIVRAVGAVALLLSLVGVAAGDTITYNRPGDFTGAFVCSDSGNAACYSPTAWDDTGADTISLKGFNTSLGNLTKVSITATAYAYGTYRIQNETAGTITIDEFISNMSTAIVKTTTGTPYGGVGFFPATNLVNSNVFLTLRPQLFDLIGVSAEAGYDSGNVSYATLGSPSFDTQTVNLCVGTTGGCVASAQNQPLSQFYGSGTINLPVYSNATTTVINGTGGNLTLSTSTNALIVVDSVTYTYDSVPEPAAVTLVGAGIVGLLIYRRRRICN